MTLWTRPATPDDAQSMCDVINPLIAAGGTTAHQTPFTTDRMIRHYIAPPLGISCVAVGTGDTLFGFQALEWADPSWDGEGKLPPDWAVIASFVSANAQGRGAGAALFAESLKRARAAGVTAIDATIRRYNTSGLTYYSRMGFVDHAEGPQTISKACWL